MCLELAVTAKTCNNAPNSTPTHTQFMCEQHLVEEEELVQDMQLREREGDEIVHVNEQELLGDVLVVVESQQVEELEEEEDYTTSSDECISHFLPHPIAYLIHPSVYTSLPLMCMATGIG